MIHVKGIAKNFGDLLSTHTYIVHVLECKEGEDQSP